ncbi:MAG: hypothetical protein FWG65_13430 [Turicibacter sp.]|nr:hypothetical protein [Turicibacter sp.]
MYDIICPNCGESFIARDVAFDFSEYVKPLISPNDEIMNNLKTYEFEFKYYIDEEAILSLDRVSDSQIQLETGEKGGYAGDFNKYYVFKLTNEEIFDYIVRRNVPLQHRENFKAFMKKLNEYATDGNVLHDAPILNDSTIIDNCIKPIWRRCYPNQQDFNIVSPAVRGLIEILLHIFKNQTESKELYVRMYCSQENKEKPEYRVPDAMFVFNMNSGKMEEKSKICRDCGHKLPLEFGYFKIVPITMLGSAYAAKTSILLALYYCTIHESPFTRTSDHFDIQTLTLDDDLTPFEINYEEYKDGYAPNKTPFIERGSAPILSFLVNNVIYVFVDYPGEAFINKDGVKNDQRSNYARDDRRIFHKSRHLICALDPSQVLKRLGEDYKEDNLYEETHLIKEFEKHIGYTKPKEKNLRSITFLANKFDAYAGEGDKNVDKINNLVETNQLKESDIYGEDGEWNEDNWKIVTENTEKFLRRKIPDLVSTVSKRYQDKKICFIPTSPYGRPAESRLTKGEEKPETPQEKNDRLAKQGFLNGLAFLRILKVDGVI